MADGPQSTLMDEHTMAWHVIGPAPPGLQCRVVGVIRVNKSQFFACLLGAVVQSDNETGHDSPSCVDRGTKGQSLVVRETEQRETRGAGEQRLPARIVFQTGMEEASQSRPVDMPESPVAAGSGIGNIANGGPKSQNCF